MKQRLFKIFTCIFSALLFLTFTQIKQVKAATKTQTVSMQVYKYTKNHRGRQKSMAQAFVGTKAKVVLNNGRVNKLIVHVNGQNNPLAQNQDVSKIVKALKINGVKSVKENISKDHSNFDFVFSKNAFKNNGWAKLNVEINLGTTMSEQAWIKFGKVKVSASKSKHVKKTRTKKGHTKKHHVKKRIKKTSHKRR